MAKEKNAENENASPQKGRSVAYPAMNLEEAVSGIEKLYAQLGKGPYSREAAAKGLGYSGVSGASARAVAALGHYGFLVRSGNAAYAISDLAREILFPTDDTGTQKATAIARAAAEPALFSKLIKKFQGQALPVMLEDIITLEGVHHKTSKEVATLFKDTLQFAGLLKNGIVYDVPTAEASADAILPKMKMPSGDSLGAFVRPQGVQAPVGVPTTAKVSTFADSGNGWTLTIASQAPISSAIKKALIDVAELLKEANEVEGESTL